MRGALALVALVWLVVGCAARSPTGAGRMTASAAAGDLLGRARERLDAGDYRGARELYLRILASSPGPDEERAARWGMAWIRVDPRSPLRNDAAARINLARLLALGDAGEGGRRWAEAWKAVLDRLDRCEAENRELRERARALEADLVDLEADLGELRALEMDIELGEEERGAAPARTGMGSGSPGGGGSVGGSRAPAAAGSH